MKMFLPLSLLLISLCSFAQSPQGINYQAVAYNSSGQPVTNQTVGVRLSILDGGANGTVVYSETQTPNTDNTGLFSIVIGNGTAVSGTFASVNWGNGSKWLKTEIDIAGGNNYVVMGSSQFMSVPYALYADKVGYASGGFLMPDGFDNSMPVIIPGFTNYTVPAGKNLYFSSAGAGIKIDGFAIIAGVSAGGASYVRSMVAASGNSVVTISDSSRIALLVEQKYEWKTFSLLNGSFTVPSGKKFAVINQIFFINYTPNPLPISGCNLTLNGIPFKGVLDNVVLDEGDVLSISGCPVFPELNININGYFINK